MADADGVSERGTAIGQWLESVLDPATLPGRAPLSRFLAPLPKLLEDVGLRLAWLIVAINLAGTAFGFWFYRFQFAQTPLVMWPFVPDSPGGTLFIALAIGAWKLGRSNEYLNAFALFGTIKLGLWTPFVLLAFFPEWGYLHPAMYNFLFWSHLAMVVEAFVLHRIADFPVKAVALAATWYTVDLVFDYFYAPFDVLTHTFIPVDDFAPWFVDGAVTNLQVAAAGAVVLTVIPLFVALATRVGKLETDSLVHPER